MLCLLTPHYTHSPLSHFCGKGTVNASRSFSQEWLTFRETVRKNRWWGEAWGRKTRPTFWQMNHWPKCRSDNTTKKRNVEEEEDRKPHKRQWTWTRHDHDWNKLWQPMCDSALMHRMTASLRLLIGLKSITDHIVMVTNGITKLTDHFVLETDTAGKESGRRRPLIAMKCLSLCVCVLLHFSGYG